MNRLTPPYNINNALGSKDWQTEYTTNFMPLPGLSSSTKTSYSVKLKQNKLPNKPVNKPFSQYKID